MSTENLPDGKLNPNEEGAAKPQRKKPELWEFTCRTCNGKFAANVYEPKYCLYCGADLHFK